MISKDDAMSLALGAAIYGIEDTFDDSIDNLFDAPYASLKGFGVQSVLVKTVVGITATVAGYYGLQGKGPLDGNATGQAIALGYGLPAMIDGVFTGVKTSFEEPVGGGSIGATQTRAVPRAMPRRIPTKSASQTMYPPRKGAIQII